ncbi:MAG: 16S rRNA (cytosine(967)-C(5))-methyltransferase RsmB [Clostridia bacterium]|nr:16S rRNA (cytosine(967)-C(5))-methyltransferase RsmB [Clostridia bacterium]
MDNPRKLAQLSLIKSEMQDCYTNIEINTVLSRAKLEKSDDALYTRLYLGVVEKKLLLDYIIGQYSKTPIEKIDVEALCAIRLGLYQLLFMDKIPDHSAVDESVELSPKRSKGFVNAILRSFLRSDKKIDYPTDEWKRLSIESSIPVSVINIFRESYGDEIAKKIVTYNDREKSLSLRINTLKATKEKLTAQLEEVGFNVTQSSFGDGIIKCSAPISKIKALIDSGEVFVQDESSYACACIVDAQKGERIADVCACPGGKTFSMAIGMQNRGEIKAYDLHRSKLSLIEKGAKRLGINIISIAEQNAKAFLPENQAAFDRVLCDVPCSGLGVIFNKPDIRYKSIEAISSLPSIQYDILKNCSQYVRVGGILVYSTCTLCKEENEKNVLRFLESNGDFEPMEFEVGNIKSQKGMFTFFPYKTGTDGFFVAKLIRKK